MEDSELITLRPNTPSVLSVRYAWLKFTTSDVNLFAYPSDAAIKSRRARHQEHLALLIVGET